MEETERWLIYTTPPVLSSSAVLLFVGCFTRGPAKNFRIGRSKKFDLENDVVFGDERNCCEGAIGLYTWTPAEVVIWAMRPEPGVPVDVSQADGSPSGQSGDLLGLLR